MTNYGIIVEWLNQTSNPAPYWIDITPDVEGTVRVGPYGLEKPLGGNPHVTSASFDLPRSGLLSYFPVLGGGGIQDYDLIRISLIGQGYANCARLWTNSFAAQLYQVGNGVFPVDTYTLTGQVRLPTPFVSSPTVAYNSIPSLGFGIANSLSAGYTSPSSFSSIGLTALTPTYWTNFSISISAGLASTPNYMTVALQFSQAGSATPSMYIELRNLSLTRAGNPGVNILTNGSFAGTPTVGAIVAGIPSWSYTGGTPCLAYDGQQIFYGFVTDVNGRPFKTGDPGILHVSCKNFVELLNMTEWAPTLQTNRSPNFLIGLAAAAFNFPIVVTGFGYENSNRASPGMQLGQGAIDGSPQIYQTSLDNYTNKTALMTIINDITTSDYGTFYVGRDGLYYYRTRDWRERLQWATPALTFTDGQPIDVNYRSNSDALHNNATMTVHPRTTLQGTATLTSPSQAVLIPHNSTITVTVFFRDSYGKPCAATNIQTLTAYTDYKITERSDGTGFDATLSPQFTITLNVQANQAVLQIASIWPTTDWYLSFFQVRGQAIIKYDPVDLEYASTGLIQRRNRQTFIKDLVFSNDQYFVLSLAQYYVNFYGQPYVEIGTIAIANEWAIGGVDIATLDVGSVVNVNFPAVSFPATGKSPAPHLVTEISYEIDAVKNSLTTTLTLCVLAYPLNWFTPGTASPAVPLVALWDSSSWDDGSVWGI